MLLTLSSESVRNTIFTDESGQVLYKTIHPFQIRGKRTTTIHKVVPNADPTDMQDQFEVMAEIEWHWVGSSTFRYNGQELLTDDFIPRNGLLGRKRTFTGPDGRRYKWDLQWSVVVLSLDDGSNMELARYHRRTLGIIGPKKKARLEIKSDVTHMLDLIILTFIYVEKLRKDKEDSAKYAAS